MSSGKITANGKVDPVALREKLEEKTHKKVELLSPVPKKDKENAKEKDGSGDGKGDKKKDSNGKDNAKNGKDEKTPKEVQKCIYCLLSGVCFSPSLLLLILCMLRMLVSSGKN